MYADVRTRWELDWLHGDEGTHRIETLWLAQAMRSPRTSVW
jgi:hypothetical protein